MTYQEFKQNIVHVISTKLGSNTRVVLQDIVKNNDVHLDGLTILTEQSNVSPTIYLNFYYEQFLKGKSLSKIYEDILISYRKNAANSNIDISFFTDYEKVKERIIFKLVNYERNKELLKKVPHVRYLDLAIIFNCFIETAIEGYATILIYHHHLSLWEITADDLYELAMQNTPKLLHYELESMTSVLQHILNEEDASFLECSSDPLPMYVLSNRSKLHGSACILYENLLSEIAQTLKSDFYILPSSIHETLLLPTLYAHSHAELSAMVRDINATQVAKEEILSDHVYFYSRTTGKITM